MTDIEASDRIWAEKTFQPEQPAEQEEEFILVSAETVRQLVKTVNSLGETMQWLADGTMNMFTFFNNLGADVNSMTLPQKLKLLKEMMG